MKFSANFWRKGKCLLLRQFSKLLSKSSGDLCIIQNSKLQISHWVWRKLTATKITNFLPVFSVNTGKSNRKFICQVTHFAYVFTDKNACHISRSLSMRVFSVTRIFYPCPVSTNSSLFISVFLWCNLPSKLRNFLVIL